MRISLIFLSVFCVSQINAYVLPENPIKTYDCEQCNSLSHESLQDRWKIKGDSLFKSSSNLQKSYSYDLQVTAKQLEAGVNLPISAPGAVIHISPSQNKVLPALELKNASSPFMSIKDAASLYSENEALDNSLQTGPNQMMFQIKPELGAGHFTIKSKKPMSHNESNSYLIHVFEKYALMYLQIEPSALHYQYGDQFNALITLKDNVNTYSEEDIDALLFGPLDQTIPVKIKEVKHNQFQASASLISETNSRGENWYIVVDVDKDMMSTPRTGRAAFSYSIPSASLIRIDKISSKPLTLAATVNVGTASRYVLQSVLYTTDKKGKTIPLELSQSASWLEPGKQMIQFSFDNSEHLSEDQLLIGYLHLTDYGQLKTVYQYDIPIKLSQLLD